jgi:Kef-type K+ transport system membrane component KefB
MHGTQFIYFIFLIFTGAAVLATLALFTRQSLLVAYILLGILLGPFGLKLLPDIALARQIGDVGIIFLLFLLGLDLNPTELYQKFQNTFLITLISSIVFIIIGFGISYLFGFTWIECLFIGAAFAFSSTIIGIKLLPTTVLHHQHIGDLMISVLLLQDLFAIAMLILVHGAHMTGSRLVDISLAIVTLPVLLALAFLLQHYFINKLFRRFDAVREYVFLLAIGWCLCFAELARVIGLPAEIGAFIAGVAIAEGPIAIYIGESLKPLRDFCLVMFFFAIGASFDLQYLPQIWLPALLLAAILLIVKPYTFNWLFQRAGETKSTAMEVGLRLGQNSEFSLLLAYLAAEAAPAMMTEKTNYLIQAATLITFVVSSYVVVLRYNTPVAFSDKLRRD